MAIGDASNTLVYTLAAPSASDAASERPFPSKTPAHYELSTAGSVLSLVVDKAWQSDPSRVFPVTIDPEVFFTEELSCPIISHAFRVGRAVAPEPGLIQRAVLTPLAASRGLDYELEFLAPGASEAGQAYGFVSCGAELLLLLTYAEGFPSKDRRATKRGVKWVVRGTTSEGAQTAAVMLAQAMALQFELLTRREGDEHSEGVHRSFRELIQRVYPLGDEALERQQEFASEYRVMETHEVPRDVQVGVRMGTGYHVALRDPEFSEYENVDEDEHLVEVQKRYADGYLRSMANLYAIELIVGEKRYAELEPKLLTPASIDYERLAQQQSELVQWVSVGKAWHKHGERVLTADREPEPLGDEIAEYLRRRTTIMLAQPKEPLGDDAAQALQAYAQSASDSEAGWNLLTDAELTGYWLRRSEEDLNEHGVLSRDAIAELVQRADPDTGGPLFVVAEAVARDHLPGLFSRDESSWSALRSWACEDARGRSDGRREHGMEQGEATAANVQGVGAAFDFGYAVRAVESALYGEDD